jgi:catechol 2,3-dioxygenase-like lactoylglutathione lyase family enzyme
MHGNNIRVTGIDHLVLNCADVETTLQWYVDQLGLEPVRLQEWRSGEVPFPSIRINERSIIDLIQGGTGEGRLDHFCLTIEPTDLDEIAASGTYDVVDGPDIRFGAQGNGRSLYIRDPDGTTLELRHY